MDHSSLSRRGALAAATGSAITLAVPAAAYAKPSALKGSTAASTVNDLLKSMPKGESLRLVIEDEGVSFGKKGPAGKRPELTDSYSTHGWDTVSAVRLTDVNRAIANAGVSPRGWRAEFDDVINQRKILGEGRFGVWAAATGGSSEILCMEMPFDAVLTVETPDGRPRKVEISDGLVTVDLRLRYIAWDGSKPQTALVVSPEPVSKTIPAVTVEDVQYGSPVKDPSITAWLKELFKLWFNANLEQFDHVFAAVSLGEDVKGDLGWLKPTSTGYAYHDSLTPDASFLGVLCMTENRSAVDIGADQLLAANAILPGRRAGLNISADRVMHKMLIPALCVQYQTDPSAFTCKSGRITGADLRMDPISVSGSTYHPQITDFSVVMAGGAFDMTLSFSVEISPGITSQIDTEYSLTPVQVTKDGQQYLTYEAEEIKTRSSVDLAWWVVVTEAVADIIIAVVFACVGSMKSMAEKQLTVTVIGLITQFVMATLESVPVIIAGEVPKGMPDMSNLVDKSTSSLQWADAGEFQVEEVVLDGALQLGGTCFN